MGAHVHPCDDLFPRLLVMFESLNDPAIVLNPTSQKAMEFPGQPERGMAQRGSMRTGVLPLCGRCEQRSDAAIPRW